MAGGFFFFITINNANKGARFRFRYQVLGFRFLRHVFGS